MAASTPLSGANQPLRGILLVVLATFLFAGHDALSKYLGGLYPVIKKAGSGVPLSWEDSGVRSGVLTTLASAIYVGFAVKSFIDARKAQAAGGQPPAAQ